MDNGQDNEQTGQGSGQDWGKFGERLRDSDLWDSEIWNNADAEFIDTYDHIINTHAEEEGNPFLAIALFSHTILHIADQLSYIPEYGTEAAVLQSTGETLINIAITGGDKYCSHIEQIE